jgi:hypothetical protein
VSNTWRSDWAFLLIDRDWKVEQRAVSGLFTLRSSDVLAWAHDTCPMLVCHVLIAVLCQLANVRRGGTPHRSYGSIMKTNKYYYYRLVRYWFTLESTNDHAHNHKHRNDRLTDKVDPKEWQPTIPWTKETISLVVTMTNGYLKCILPNSLLLPKVERP